MRLFKRVSLLGRLMLLALACIVPLGIGTLGFQWIEGATAFDSFYLTLITLTTIGYGETIELSRPGRLFNSGLILLGFGAVFVSVGVFAEYLIAFRVLERIQQGALKRMLKRMSGHYVICGLGRVGLGVLGEMRRETNQVIVIDKSGGTEKAHSQSIDVPILAEDATVPATLELARVAHARGLVAALSSDAENVYITLSARVLNPNIRIVARASSPDARGRLLQAGADRVVMPYAFTGRRLALAMLRPHSSDFLRIAGGTGEAEKRLEIGECPVGPGGTLAGRTIGGVNLAAEYGLIPLALAADGDQARFNPPASSRLSEGDVLVVVGPRQSIDRLYREGGGH